MVFMNKYFIWIYKTKDAKLNQERFSRYNESVFFDWKEIYLQKRMLHLYNLDPEINSTLQKDELFPEKYSSIGLSNIDSLSWTCKVY